MTVVNTGTHKFAVRHFPAATCEVWVDDFVCLRLNKNDAMILSDLISQVAYQLPADELELRRTVRNEARE
jgi:hypothetical protein